MPTLGSCRASRQTPTSGKAVSKDLRYAAAEAGSDDVMPSSVIHSFDYDPQRRELLIVFNSGRRYIYQGVPQETFEGMRAAASRGDYFNTHIRENFAFVRG
jgi:hypothetical protein